MEKVLQPVLALSISSSLGGSERSLAEFAVRAKDLAIDLHVLVPEEGPLTELLRDADVPTDTIPEFVPLLPLSQQEGKLSPVAAAISLPHFRRAGRAIARIAQPHTVLYSNSFKTHLATIWARKRPSVWHLREFPPTVTGPVWKFLARQFPARLIANSHDVGRTWTIDSVRVVHNGIDLERFCPRNPTGWIHDRLGIPTDHKLIGMPAIFAEWKGHQDVIDAFERLQDDFADVHLVFVGGPIYDTVAERRFA
ncbi:MAG: glycosyltransferase, partial [Gemmatimonadales bacterium]